MEAAGWVSGCVVGRSDHMVIYVCGCCMHDCGVIYRVRRSLTAHARWVSIEQSAGALFAQFCIIVMTSQSLTAYLISMTNTQGC